MVKEIPMQPKSKLDCSPTLWRPLRNTLDQFSPFYNLVVPCFAINPDFTCIEPSLTTEWKFQNKEKKMNYSEDNITL